MAEDKNRLNLEKKLAEELLKQHEVKLRRNQWLDFLNAPMLRSLMGKSDSEILR